MSRRSFHACRSNRVVFLCWPLDERLRYLRQHRPNTFFTSMIFHLMFPSAQLVITVHTLPAHNSHAWPGAELRYLILSGFLTPLSIPMILAIDTDALSAHSFHFPSPTLRFFLRAAWAGSIWAYLMVLFLHMYSCFISRTDLHCFSIHGGHGVAARRCTYIADDVLLVSGLRVSSLLALFACVRFTLLMPVFIRMVSCSSSLIHLYPLSSSSQRLSVLACLCSGRCDVPTDVCLRCASHAPRGMRIWMPHLAWSYLVGTAIRFRVRPAPLPGTVRYGVFANICCYLQYLHSLGGYVDISACLPACLLGEKEGVRTVLRSVSHPIPTCPVSRT
jgi:hypothetical protein